MARIIALFFLAFVCLCPGRAQAQPLVDAAWLKASLGQGGLVVLDVRSAVDGHSEADYREVHIPGAVYSDYVTAGWRITDENGTPGMLPDVRALENLIGGLGIDNETHVVIVPAGEASLDVGSATRIYWTFKVLGHDAVSILDGGMAAWRADSSSPLESGMNVPEPREFRADLLPRLLAGKDEVRKAIGTEITLIDNRPYDQHVGVNKSSVADRYGTIPGAKSFPESWVTKDGGGKFRDPDSLAKLYEAAGIDTAGEQITFCNTAHWASLGWFVSHELLGNKRVKLYDGSIAEWSADLGLPVERRIAGP